MDAIIIGGRIKFFMKFRQIKRKRLAKELGISCKRLARKLNGKEEFFLDELWKLKDILNIDNELMSHILFDKNFFVEFEGKGDC